MTTCDLSTDDGFLSAFNDCSAPPSAFNHLGHLRIGWVHLQRYPLQQAIDLTCDGIDRFASFLGVPGKYNRTLSEALMLIMAHGGGADRARSFDVFLAENPALVGDALGLLGRYYTGDLLNSPTARKTFVAPDISPLP
jgi:N-formylglutamate deformylase